MQNLLEHFTSSFTLVIKTELSAQATVIKELQTRSEKIEKVVVDVQTKQRVTEQTITAMQSKFNTIEARMSAYENGTGPASSVGSASARNPYSGGFTIKPPPLPMNERHTITVGGFVYSEGTTTQIFLEDTFPHEMGFVKCYAVGKYSNRARSSLTVKNSMWSFMTRNEGNKLNCTFAEPNRELQGTLWRQVEKTQDEVSIGQKVVSAQD